MKPRTTISTVFLTTLVSMSSCASSGISDGPARVDDFVGWVERVYVETELARERMNDAVAQLEALVGSTYAGDPVTAYTSFVEALRLSEAQAERLDEQIEPMKKAAEPVFEQWEESLGQFQSESMRERSGARLQATKDRYTRVLGAVEPARERFAKLNGAMRDHALFLGNDFNAEAVASVHDDARELIALASDLDREFEECLSATRAYVETSALPLQAAPAPGGAARFRR
ncbi:MAG: DUF2959 family protein [Planctomycetes bacterium]|nr:DUF2959 family protein [Planctomycetota bacterium]